MKSKIVSAKFQRFFAFAGKYQLGYGLLFSLIFPLLSLPIRIAQIHRDTVSNLVGSEIIMFLHGLATWLLLRFVIIESGITSRWLKIFAGLLGSAVLSVVFLELSPFEDFPWLPVKQLPVLMRIPHMINKGAFRGFFIMITLLLTESQEKERRARTENKNLAEHNLIYQINELSYQLEPHFLFNSLNFLKSGASELWVKDYIIQLSGIYRYLLNNSHGSGLTFLEDELEFTLGYVSMMAERFDKGLIFNNFISEADGKRKVPMLAMQILVENAVKHNMLSQERPLNIYAYCEDSYLIIVNELLPKKGYSAFSNTGVGLKNLQERCQLLLGKFIVIIKEENNFIVKVPMI